MNLETNIEKLQKKVEHNASKIEENTEKIKSNAYALGILREFKNDNKRYFVIIITILIMWFATIGYLVYVLNDIGVEETTTTETTTTQEIEDVDSIDDSYIINGDNYGKN